MIQDIFNQIINFFSKNYENYRVTQEDNTIIVNNHIADFNEKSLTVDGKQMSIYLLGLAIEEDLEINRILNEFSEAINEKTCYDSFVLNPGNVIEIKESNDYT